MRLLAFVITASTVMVATSHAGLVNHWTFDSADTSGLVASDTAGAVANDATWQEAGGAGLTLGVAGQIGEAISLDGDNGGDRHYIVSNGPGASMEIAGTTALSISMWIRPNLTQNSGATGIFTGRGSSINRASDTFTNQFWGTGWEVVNGDGRRLRGDSTGATRSVELYDGTESETEWFHVVFTWEGDGAGVAASADDDPTAVYINGLLATDGNADVNADLYNSGTWIIGGDPGATADRNFGGLLDDLAVYDMALTPQNVAAIYAGGLLGRNAAEVGLVPEPASILVALLGATIAGAIGIRKRLG